MDGTTPWLVNCPPTNAVVTLNAFCCPGVGARNPLLTAPRSASVSVNSRRAETLPFVVRPKSLESLEPESRAERPLAIRGAELEVAVGRNVAAAPTAAVVSAR